MTKEQLIQLYYLLVLFRNTEKPGERLYNNAGNILDAIEVHPVYRS